MRVIEVQSVISDEKAHPLQRAEWTGRFDVLVKMDELEIRVLVKGVPARDARQAQTAAMFDALRQVNPNGCLVEYEVTESSDFVRADEIGAGDSVRFGGHDYIVFDIYVVRGNVNLEAKTGEVFSVHPYELVEIGA